VSFQGLNNFLSQLLSELWSCKVAWKHQLRQDFEVRIFRTLVPKVLMFINWDLSLFIYFYSMSGLLCTCCWWPESKNIVRSRHSLNFTLLRLFCQNPSCPLQLGMFWKGLHIRLSAFSSNRFTQSFGFHFRSSGQLPFENNFKQIIDCPVTWFNMNEPSM